MEERIQIKEVARDRVEEVLALIWEVFQEFVAKDYTEEGKETFYQQFICGERFRDKIKEGRETVYGAYIKEQLVGVLSISNNHTISCAFVKGIYHRRGVGRKLFERVLKELKKRGATEVTLNASPYAVAFYHHIGFQDIEKQTSYKGIVYTPMKLQL